MLEIKGQKATATIKTPHGGKLLLTGEVKLDATTSPRRLDWIKFTGADQQEFPPVLGIYTVEGDRFTVCNGGLNGSRPSEFKPGMASSPRSWSSSGSERLRMRKRMGVVRGVIRSRNDCLSVVSCQLSVVSCQLSVVSCQLSVVSCQLSVVSCQLSVVSCQLSVVSCQLSVVSCQLSVVE